MTLQRELIQIVEIDIPYCDLTYGTGSCTAVLGTDGVRKCYNTFATCQDTANFTAGTKTLRFAQNVDGLPRASRIYPSMATPVSTNPSRVNLGGVSDRTGPLGKRERVTIKLKDFTDSDIWFDKYQSERVDGSAQTDEGGYNPQDRGTFFAKLRRRFPYYVGKPLRILEGKVGTALASMRTRHYVISEWDGPDAAGNVTIVAKDVLDLADNKKALCPTPSQGKLGVDITTSTPSFDLVPATVGSEYPTSGRASIGSEIVSYTRSGDTVTLTGRGLDGTEVATHSADDLFQEAFRADGDSIATVVRNILRDYAGISSSFIPFSDWTDEANRWLAGFDLTATIAKPIGVTKLIGELCQFGIMIWWDNENQEIKLRANRPLDLGETLPSLSDAKTFIEKTIGNSDLHEERLSRVLFWHGMIDSAGSATDGTNFRRVTVAIDESAEGANEYDQTQVIEIYSRWLGDGDDSIAGAVAARLLNRYRDTPRQISFSYDAKDAADIQLGSPIEVTSRLLTDDTGNSLPTQMQITSIEEVIADHRLKATAQDYAFGGRYGFITENSRPDYAASSDAQKTKGTYIVGASLLFGDGTGPYLMF
jgi:hypothetical protein